MRTLTIEVPDGLDDNIDEYLKETGEFVNKSDFVRHTLRWYMEEHTVSLSRETLEDIRIAEEQFEKGKSVPLDDLEYP